ncbi:hypothetical protein GCM10027052_20070 [Parafrigoribacterium mesophilum]|uniref:hypothetical protein n=1 Tax=Parafrigoribacterium mesophilum TaxID=433646 RepID=UPI0031FCEAC4
MNASPELTLTRRTFATLRRELKTRSGGHRESGAFLLTRSAAADPKPTRIDAIAYYDDLDPTSLTGNITFTAAGYSALGRLCRANGYRVAADIHTHPAEWVQQSSIDAAHPMTAITGHLAIIAPDFAQHRFRPGDCGIHRYVGAGAWESAFATDADRLVRLTGAPAFTDVFDTITAWFHWDGGRS